MKIGMTYIKGSLPGFETFGNLPTNIVKSNGLVNGKKAHKELDALIIPGGSIIESQSVSDELADEIKKIAINGGLIVGICSGFQVLGNWTDVGRKSPQPILKNGLGLLDVNFSPLISNDRVEGVAVNDSILTKDIKDGIHGFHCHTYGKIENNETEIIYSKLKRVNYKNIDEYSVSGVRNDDGNVIGTMIHGIFDNNPKIVNNFLEYIGASDNDIINIKNRNKEFLDNINKEIAIESNINILNNSNSINHPIVKYIRNKNKENLGKGPLTLMIGSTGSDSGKTFITTGIAGNLRKLGLNVAILKIGPDIRDTVPGLYLTKGLMEDYGSIKIGNLGWMEIAKVIEKFKKSNYDFVLIEGAMSILIGLLKDIVPYSGAEIAKSSNIPITLVSSVNKSGIESSAVDVIGHFKILDKIGIEVSGIILNKVYDMDIFNNMLSHIKNKTNIDNIIAIPKIKMEERGSTPEVEISLEDFGISAMNTVEKYVDLEELVKIAKNPEFKGFSTFKEIKSYFKS
ncbi:nucleotide-binding protein [Methanobrevibacter filiformis]|uniref:Cobyric acid synthase n=1 Tax=Methanobrevibacter filiformis TaxID=55758 RepID=A0A166C1R9_9EURY|nr:AAA family ATPase [Methanobrevibacter filiformis]KZX10657.1 cobyric acid synthase [Methanobrevibacter filiformis]